MLSTFFPPDPPRPGGVLRRWLTAVPSGWARAVIGETTRPGDLVIDPFAQSETVGRIALQMGRSVAVADFNPVQTLALRAALTPPSAQVVARAVHRLAESVKVDRPLRDAVQVWYATRCPQCRADATADAFVWDTGAGGPPTLTRKMVACQACGWQGTAPADADDQARGGDLEPLSLAYWWLVERLADKADALRPLAERLTTLYTPRAQRAVADIIRHLDNLDLSPDEGEALRMVIAGALDAASSLNTTPWDTSPPRRLDPPRRYVEVNVWGAVSHVAAALRDAPPGPDGEWVGAAAQLETDAATPFAFVGRLPTRALAEALPGRARLAIGAPPRMSPVFWTLSWAWSGWLWSRRAAAPLRPLAGRGGDWDWYSQALTTALGAVRAALTPDGRIALAWSADRAALDAIAVAAARSGLGLEQAVMRAPRAGARGLDAQTVFATAPAAPPRLAAEEFRRVSRDLAIAADASAWEMLAAWGEPLAAETLAEVALADMARDGRLAEAVGLFEEPLLGSDLAHAKVHDALAAAVAAGRLARLEDGRVWPLAGMTGLPLADRVEQSVLAQLYGGTARAGESVEEAAALTLGDVYAAHPGRLAPDTELVQLILETHARPVGPEAWAAVGAVEPLRQAVQDLLLVGEALGYSVQFPLTWSLDERLTHTPAEVVWLSGGRPTLRFVLQASALLASLQAPPPLPVPHVLVAPDAVARLLRTKLRRAPHIAAQAEAAGWDFLVAERLHRWLRMPQANADGWRDALGLTERVASDSQLRLFDPGAR